VTDSYPSVFDWQLIGDVDGKQLDKVKVRLLNTSRGIEDEKDISLTLAVLANEQVKEVHYCDTCTIYI